MLSDPINGRTRCTKVNLPRSRNEKSGTLRAARWNVKGSRTRATARMWITLILLLSVEKMYDQTYG